MVNNKELIKPLLTFPHEHIFYFVQILQRKKDHQGTALGGSNNNSRLIKAYYITSVEKLEVHWEEMVKLAEVFNARVSINLNPRNFEKAGFQVMQKIANQMMNKDYYGIRKAYDSICGEYHSEIDKRWLIDIDKEDMDKRARIYEVINFLQNLSDNVKLSEKKYKILAEIPSRTGCHIITQPFNLMDFHKEFPSIEIHKNNPTNLYIP